MGERSIPTLYARYLKRLFDLIGSGVALCLLAPVFGTVALLVRLRLGSPVIFRQSRPGLAGVPFELIKFRTMSDRADLSGQPLPDERRLEGFGSFLRSTSLDELPELWNVFKGEMSLVGPRPLLMRYLDRYSPEQRRRHEVRPGITGLAQVNGRNDVGWEDKFRWDIDYVRRLSFALDLVILARSIAVVVRRKGISQPGRATAEEFMGSEHRT
jgi:sugar transferase EpsL